MNNHYRMWTFADIARLPDECLDKFFAELPAMVSALKPLMILAETMKGGTLTPEEEQAAFGQSQWVDDDLRNIRTTINIEDRVVMERDTSMDSWQ